MSGSDGSGGTGPALDRSVTPPAGKVRPFHFPEVRSGELDNGLSLRTVRLARLPVVSTVLVLDAGEATVDEDRAGLAVLTGDALEGGTEHRSGGELAEALEGIGASLRVSTGWDACSIGLSCLADDLEEAMGLLSEVVLRPGFPPEEVARYRSQRLAAIQQRRKDPGSLADDEAVRWIFADGVPYGRPQAGTPGTVEPLGHDDTRRFAHTRYRPARGGLMVVGDVDPEEVGALTRDRLGGWSGAGPDSADFTPEPRFPERRVVVVHRPGAVQSEIRMGHVGVPRSAEDYFELLIFNAILGGTFTSRLNLNLREEHGFTYGVRSRFSFRRQAGPFRISTAVATDVTADAVREAISEVEGLVAEGPTDEEVDQARSYIAGVFPLRFETTSQVASRLAELVVYGLPDDYHHTYRDRIRTVTPEGVARAGRRRVRPEELTVLVVGDAEEIREPLEALELGPVEVVEAGDGP